VRNLIMAEPIFDAPIPGSSLTREIESLPYKNPPKYNTVEDAIDFYIERMSTEEFSDKLVNSLKLGVSVTQIANLMQTHGVMEGQHTLDVSMLILPVLMEFIRLIAESRGVEYNMGIDDYDPSVADEAFIARAVDELKAASQNKDISAEEEVLPVEEDTSLDESMTTGLMARGI
jgi:hypothetical protein